ncbi:MAG: COX15/CtaA family protein [Chitinophagaceae bacterium]|nr:COX15/CtaA family protein [Chitinophagaceae bacterium]
MTTAGRSDRLVMRWLQIGIVMTIFQIALGGITRLTGSGLSITEWEVITGVLPPLNHEEWVAAFEAYRKTPQYQLLNYDFQLPDFQFIFFWEWFHRLWARLIGLVFAVGFIWLLLGKHFKKSMVTPLLILFVLGGLQGAIGWIMVKSGLTGDAVYVKPTRLALHFVFALGLLCYTWWFTLQLQYDNGAKMNHRGFHRWVLILLGVMLIQLAFGALMAGHKAATAASTWPTINGEWFPFSLQNLQLKDFVENPILIHFVHRSLAYFLLIAIVAFSFKLGQTNLPPAVRQMRWLPVWVVLIQVLLGISSLLTSKGIVPGKWGGFEWTAQLHQLTGMVLLLVMVKLLYLIRPVRS